VHKRSKGNFFCPAASHGAAQPLPRSSAGSSEQKTHAQSLRRENNGTAASCGPDRTVQNLKKYDMLIVVEGVNDMKAVRRAVPHADVFVLGTATRAGDPILQAEIHDFGQRYRGILLLLDPDVAGRQARNILSSALHNCYHAFVPTLAASASTAVRMKKAGDIGVEHADAAAIRKALSNRRKSTPERTTFHREALQAAGLIAQGMGQRGGDVTERRNLVCSYLGLGVCDGKQLLRQLNAYGFEEGDLAAALAWAQQQLEK
jgi:ribonuclease M5